MRLFFALFGLALLTAAAPAPKPVPVTLTASGTYVLGSPAARVKLVEYASYTCSHCADFSTQSQAVLKGKMIASGSTSLEFRHMIRDRLDLAAAVLARCTGPRGFFPTSAAIFAAQPAWLEKGIEFQQVNAARINLYPRPAQLKAYADGAGLTDLVKARGLSAAAIDACFADTAEIDRILAITAAAPPEVDSTPSFFINGKVMPHGGWAQLEPALRAAGAR
ncbi:thioredoxin domain-containing protein [Sphingomonas sp. PvP018]|uniref:DsbA family protein n=1 Tax=Sphingomonas sp. PvP018 TaxID=2817852 RepID=UPI001AE593B5|nr:thioredoxin domain-containing protein [Sphingomonas sp. PvP018]MBP2514444.1 protein-disulfide isomerase [Sphingomonas sp. PvP018]